MTKKNRLHCVKISSFCRIVFHNLISTNFQHLVYGMYRCDILMALRTTPFDVVVMSDWLASGLGILPKTYQHRFHISTLNHYSSNIYNCEFCVFIVLVHDEIGVSYRAEILGRKRLSLIRVTRILLGQIEQRQNWENVLP